jgi:predicted metal-dependent peptidase
MEGRNPLVWNIAADYAINENLIEAGFKLPEGACLDKKYYGMGTEEIYSLLMKEIEEQKDKEKGEGTGGMPGLNGSGGEQGKGSSEPNQDEENEDEDGEGSSDGDPSDGNSSGKDDPKEEKPEKEKPPVDPNGYGGVLPAPKGSEKESKAEWTSAVKSAMTAGRGTLPGNLKRILEEANEEKIAWHVLLRDFVEMTARNDYNWMRPNTRHLGRGFVLPSLLSEELNSVVIAVDTSGSINVPMLNQFAKEASAVLGSYQTEIRVVYCDSKVQGDETFTSEDLPMEMNPKGGGGTAFEPVFKWVEDEGIMPSCLIYFTDMYGSFPKTEPDYPVMWVTDTKGYDKKVPFGTVIEFEMDQ